MKNHILHTYGFNLVYARMLVRDVSDEQMCAQPAPAMNHAAWVLGHLASTCDFMGSLVGVQHAGPAEWKELFSGGTKPVCEAGRYPRKEALVLALEEGHARVAGAFERAQPELLSQPTPVERMRPRFPTIGDLVVFGMTSHEALHLGQLSAWRRALGLPSAF